MVAYGEVFRCVVLTAGLISGGAAVLCTIRGSFRPQDPVYAIYGIALAVRLPLAILLAYWLPPQWLELDSAAYEREGWRIAQTWQFDQVYRYGDSFWVHVLTNAGMFALVGFRPVMMCILSAVVGAFACGLVFVITYGLFRNPRVATAGGLLVCFWPTIVAWSTPNAKDMLLTSALLGMVYCAIAINQRPRASTILLLFILAAVATSYRIYLAAALVPLCAVYVLAEVYHLRRKHPLSVVAALIVLGLVALGFTTTRIGTRIVSRLGHGNLERINFFRAAAATGGARLAPQPFQGWGELAAFLPVGVLNFFLRPFPWETGSLNQTMGAFEMLLIYVILVAAATQVPRLWRRDRLSTAFVLGYLLVFAIGYGLLETNLGSMLKHRIPQTMVMIGMAAGVLAQEKEGETGSTLETDRDVTS